MGIYSNFNSSYVDDGSFTPRDLFAECGETATYEELSLAMVAENEQNYISIMKAIGLNEVNYFAENGEEIVYEAGGVSGILTKIKEFFKKLIEKVRQILHTFIAKISSMASSDSSFVQKYQKEFSTKWSKVKSDFGFKGYKFTVKLAPAQDRTSIATTTLDALTHDANGNPDSPYYEVINGNIDSLITGAKADADNLKKELDKSRDNREDNEESIRGEVANTVSTTCGKGSIGKGPLTAAEFSKELFEDFRNGESEKDTIEKKDLSVAEIVSDVKDSEKFKKAAEKATNSITKALNDVIKKLDKAEKELVKAQSGDKIKTQSGDDKTNSSNILSSVLGLVTYASDMQKFTSNCYTQANGIYLQAITDRKRQAKAIMVKVIGGGKKMTNESYDYDNDYEGVAETANYFDNIVLK